MEYLPTFQTIDLKNPPPRIASQAILTYFEFRGKSSLTVICMDPHSPNKLIVTKYCFLILAEMIPVSFSFFSFLFCYVFLFILLL